MPKALTERQIEQFESQGYLCLLDCMTPEEAQACRDRFEAFERDSGLDVLGDLRIKSHLGFPWMTGIARHPRVLDAIEDLIGPDILAFASTVWIKNAADGKFVSWHQDSPYFDLEPKGQVVAWVALTDSHRGNGCMRVIPGTHLGSDLPHVETFAADNLLTRGQTIEGVDAAPAVDLELRAGQFSLHHDRVIHGSAPNDSDDRRIGIAFTYFPTATRSLVGRRPALLVRGHDDYGHWDPDLEPRFDGDPLTVAHAKRCTAQYSGQGDAG